ncbi:hypothetical protein DPMN_098649 [Dreissena polymorpha]|uniref:Uncharacterized protein n=1 Tax=Dreissena polymorpha TaxID=45954 RepID=A0A9D4LE12_DREPO|nr:hypothetical protein DPMN_098618 [Dreissena polymorpha]KAH3856069.1 hypothetical protein DPMN_098649 [Dreissena polymorpha]
MTNNNNDIRDYDEQLETVTSFNYLEAIVTDVGSKHDILAKTAAALLQLLTSGNTLI